MARDKYPVGNGWRQSTVPIPSLPNSIFISAWRQGKFFAISELAMIGAPRDESRIIQQWIISISRKGNRRPTIREVRRVLRDFNMWPAEEDNHERGQARKFWMPVDPAERVDCACKADEETVVEPDGYRWSRKRVES